MTRDFYRFFYLSENETFMQFELNNFPPLCTRFVVFKYFPTLIDMLIILQSRLKRSLTTVVENDALHLRVKIFLAVGDMCQLCWDYDWRLLKVSLNYSTLLSHCGCCEIWNVAAVITKAFKLHWSEFGVKFLPQIPNLSIAIENIVWLVWADGRTDSSGLCNDSVDSRVYAWSLNSITMHSIVVTNQVTVTDESSATKRAFVVLTCGNNFE